jgi:hypothetical protein
MPIHRPSVARAVTRLAALALAGQALAGCYAAMHRAEAQAAASPAPPAPSATEEEEEPEPVAPQPAPTATPKAVAVPLRVYPLPGGLDRTDVFNSNNPEIVEEAGILLSTLPAREPGDASAFLGHAFRGRFALFSHHLTREARPWSRVLYLGLVATNGSDRRVDLQLRRGATYLTQPDAPFVPLPAVTPDPEGRVFAGPGDRTTSELLHDRSPVPPRRFAIAPRQSTLVYSLAVPANTGGDHPANGRGTMMEFQSTGPVHLSEVALFVARGREGTFKPPTLAQYQQVLGQRVLAGRREAPAYFYDPTWPVAEGFRYGRVAGVTRGDVWKAVLFGDGTPLPGVGERVGFPIAALYKKRLGTGQVQSAPMIRRYHDAAVQGQGNYGVTYDVTLRLANPDAAPRVYELRLTSPEDVAAEAGAHAATYLDPPSAQVTFRGAVRLDWPAPGGTQTRYVHLVLHQGERVPAFERVAVPPRTTTPVRLRLKYPADATPPQLLTVTRAS